ncbi:Glycine N-methyltransferase [Eumeta japonica]|uniref:Glycine N-methyltransferase n=1 Tax=Eumeta variegata TaxID=151549 RepID=A0A4C1SMS4_EUMVA|nr:Glycine N-methyltransferase [Eumeta japonica]
MSESITTGYRSVARGERIERACNHRLHAVHSRSGRGAKSRLPILESGSMAADKVFVSRSAGIPSEGVKDQYADGKAARIWKKFIGDSNERTQKYKDFLIGLLKKHNCVKILDAACGTGPFDPKDLGRPEAVFSAIRYCASIFYRLDLGMSGKNCKAPYASTGSWHT